jgi:hypothetical protein
VSNVTDRLVDYRTMEFFSAVSDVTLKSRIQTINKFGTSTFVFLVEIVDDDSGK